MAMFFVSAPSILTLALLAIIYNYQCMKNTRRQARIMNIYHSFNNNQLSHDYTHTFK